MYTQWNFICPIKKKRKCEILRKMDGTGKYYVFHNFHQWGPSVQITKPMGEISHSNHYNYLYHFMGVK